MRKICLMYHCVFKEDATRTGFQNTTAFNYKLQLRQFESQINAISAYLENRNLSKTYVEFTFDDGGVSSYTAIRPILEKYGLKGVFFIATNYIGTDGFMSAEQIEQLSDMGHSIGSHSCSHPERMDILSKDELNREWIESSNLLTEIIGHGIDAASIPNGYSSKAVINAIKDAGFKKIYTSKPTTKVIEKGGISIIGRYAVTSDMTTEYVLGLVSSRKARMKIELRNAVLGMAKAVMGNFYLTVRKKLLAHE